MKKNFSNKKLLIFTAVPTIFFLFLLEIGLRVWGETQPNRVLCYDPIIGRSYCPNTKGYLKDNQINMFIKINADGLLGKPYPVRRIPGKLRIAVLGDSFTSGEAVVPEKKFSGVWETKLSEKFPSGVEVINFGVGGTGTWQQLQIFHIKVRKYKPDLIVLAFCWCNDLDDNIGQFKEKGDTRNPLLDQYSVNFLGWLEVKRKNFNKWLWNNSSLYQFTRVEYNRLEHAFKHQAKKFLFKKGVADTLFKKEVVKTLESDNLSAPTIRSEESKIISEEPKKTSKKARKFSKDSQKLLEYWSEIPPELELNKRPSKEQPEVRKKWEADRKHFIQTQKSVLEYQLQQYFSNYDQLYSFDSESWGITKKLILKLHDEVRENGSELAVVHFGGQSQYNKNSRPLPLKEFDEFLANQGISNLNMFNYFPKVKEKSIKDYYIPQDGHFNEKGHAMFAGFALEFLENILKAKA